MTLVTVTDDDWNWTADNPTPMPEWYPADGDWTVDHLARMPETNIRHELYDGVLVVSPSATPRHQRVVGNLYTMLRAECPDELEVFFAPLDFQPGPKRSFQPDVLVCRRDSIGQKNVTVPPALVVEVASPSTRGFDLIFKREMYRASGVASYWIVDPEAVTVEALDLVNGAYRTVAKAAGPDRVRLELPYPVEICPAELMSDGSTDPK
jgi:Uma2 family endonuclease